MQDGAILAAFACKLTVDGSARVSGRAGIEGTVIGQRFESIPGKVTWGLCSQYHETRSETFFSVLGAAQV